MTGPGWAVGVDPSGAALTQVKGITISAPEIPGELAFTASSHTGPMVAIAIAMLLLGCATMLARRRLTRG